MSNSGMVDYNVPMWQVSFKQAKGDNCMILFSFCSVQSANNNSIFFFEKRA